MKKIIILISIISFSLTSCKTWFKGKAGAEDNTVYEMVDELPAYPGGDDARMQFVVKNLVYPPLAVENGLQGKVIITFIVEKDGTTSNINVAKTFDEQCGNEAKRVVSLMKWNPGKIKGKPVRSRVAMPFTFKLN